MRILILKSKKQKNSYTACIHSLLQDIGQRKGYAIHVEDSLAKASPAAGSALIFVTVDTHSAVGKLIQQLSLTSFIKENKIDLLIQNAASIIKQKIVPQLLIADNIEQLPPVKKISYSKIFLLTYSLFAKHAIADKGFTNIVHIAPFCADAVFQPVNWSMKQQVKIDYTEGREYFFTFQNFHSLEDILNLLKAFSGFKKWQHSSMKLVLAGKLQVPQDDWEEKWSTYKYREDVLVYNKLPEEQKAKLLAAAYANIHLPQSDSDLLPLFQSVQCHTPAITFETPSIKEYAADAVLFAAAGNFEALAQQMILMYKDENKRTQLVENCILLATKFSREQTIQALQNIIL